LLPGSFDMPSEVEFSEYNEENNQVVFKRVGLNNNEVHKIIFQTLIVPASNNDHLDNTAFITSGNDSTFSNRDSRSAASTKIILPNLKISKSVNRRVAEIGDFLTYSVKLTNGSIDDPVVNLKIIDLLPTGFRYRKNSSYWQNTNRADPAINPAGKEQMELVWTVTDTLQPGESRIIRYRVNVGINSGYGESKNQVYAQASTLSGFELQSEIAKAAVVINPGILGNRGVILGKIYYDRNLNGLQDNQEPGAPHVELVTETGIRVTTDLNGKYSIPNVESGIHVLRLNEHSLPELVFPRLDSPDFLGDSLSRLVRVVAGGIAKANFALEEQISFIPGYLSGQVFYDANRNSIFDAEELPLVEAEFTLDDTVQIKTDSSGIYAISGLSIGEHILSINNKSIPDYAFSLFDPDNDKQIDSTNWRMTISSGDSMNFVHGFGQFNVLAVLSAQSRITMKTEMPFGKFHRMVYRPWKMIVRLEFGSGKGALQPEIHNDMILVGKLLAWQSHLSLEIHGHTDNLPVPAGSNFDNNQLLSLYRAENIRNYLINELNIEPERVGAYGFGDTRPLADNFLASGRSENRRVELVFYDSRNLRSENGSTQLQFDMNYSGEVPLTAMQLHQVLPQGFGYITNSALWNNEDLEPIIENDSLAIWSLGDWQQKFESSLGFSMIPVIEKEINDTTTIQTFLGYSDPYGVDQRSDTLTTNIAATLEELSFNMDFENIHFESSSAELLPKSYPSLDKLGEFLPWESNISITIEGFSDNKGTDEFNLFLSEQRAISVRDYLISNFSACSDKIQIRARGANDPVADNSLRSGLALNRRVEIVLNAETGGAALVEFEPLVDTLEARIIYPTNPLEIDSSKTLTELIGDQNVTLNLNLSYPDFGPVDQIHINYHIEGASFTAHNNSRMESIVDTDPQTNSLITEFQFAVPDKDSLTINAVIQFYYLGQSVSPNINKTWEFNIRR